MVALKVREEKSLAVDLAKELEWVYKQVADLLTFQHFRRNLAPIAERTRDVTAVFILADFVQRLMELRAKFPELHLSLIDRDADQPTAELTFSTELIDVTPGLKDCILCAIFRLRFIVRNRKADDIDLPLVLRYKVEVQFPIAG